MKPKEKAKDLIDRFMKQQPMHITMQKVSAKQCALICVNQIIENDYGSRQSMDFWKEVKQEIKKL